MLWQFEDPRLVATHWLKTGFHLSTSFLLPYGLKQYQETVTEMSKRDIPKTYLKAISSTRLNSLFQTFSWFPEFRMHSMSTGTQCSLVCLMTLQSWTNSGWVSSNMLTSQTALMLWSFFFILVRLGSGRAKIVKKKKKKSDPANTHTRCQGHP